MVVVGFGGVVLIVAYVVVVRGLCILVLEKM